MSVGPRLGASATSSVTWLMTHHEWDCDYYSDVDDSESHCMCCKCPIGARLILRLRLRLRLMSKIQTSNIQAQIKLSEFGVEVWHELKDSAEKPCIHQGKTPGTSLSLNWLDWQLHFFSAKVFAFSWTPDSRTDCVCLVTLHICIVRHLIWLDDLQWFKWSAMIRQWFKFRLGALIHDSWSMIQVFVILENVQKKQTEQVVVEELRKLGYTVQAFYANSASFGLPQSRTRLYVLGVDARSERCKLIHGPEQWQAWLQASRQGNMLQLQSAAGSCIIFNVWSFSFWVLGIEFCFKPRAAYSMQLLSSSSIIYNFSFVGSLWNYDAWYDMIWYDMIWCDYMIYDIWYMIWYDTIWYDRFLPSPPTSSNTLLIFWSSE